MAQDYTTMRVPTDAYEAAKDEKREKETWGEFIQRCTDTPPAIREFVERDADAGLVSLEATERRKIAEEVAEVLR